MVFIVDFNFSLKLLLCKRNRAVAVFVEIPYLVYRKPFPLFRLIRVATNRVRALKKLLRSHSFYLFFMSPFVNMIKETFP
jgi:hypothetical protein